VWSDCEENQSDFRNQENLSNTSFTGNCYHVINIQWTKFERKSIVTFISEELPYVCGGFT